jgi:uncharacterized membrane protein YhaH (DUF805 family)
MTDNLLSFEGRMRRKHYWISAVLTPIIALIAILLIVAIAAAISRPIAVVLMIGFAVVFIWHELAESTKRCHDIGLSGWFQLIPFFGLVLLFKAGDAGPNKYGPDPKLTAFKTDDDLDLRRPRSQFDEEMAKIRAEREVTT